MKNTTKKNVIAKLRAIRVEMINESENGVTALNNPEAERICQEILKIENSIVVDDNTDFDPMAPIF